MSYNKRVFSAFKPSEDERASWKLNDRGVNQVDLDQGRSQRSGSPYSAQSTHSMDSIWNDAEEDFHHQHSQPVSVLTNRMMYTDISNTNNHDNVVNDYSKVFTVPPGLYAFSPHMTDPLVLQDNTNLRQGHYLSNYNQQHQNKFKSRNANQKQYAKHTYNQSNKENEHLFGHHSERSTWSEVIAKENMTERYSRMKPVIHSPAIQQFFKDKPLENTTLDMANNPSSLKNSSGPKYISDSVYLMSSINNNTDYDNTAINRPYTVVKVSNIPWGLNIDSIKRVFQACKVTQLPSESELPQAIHILMDVKDGKTTGVAYVEAKFLHQSTPEDIAYVISTFKLFCTQSRRVQFELSTYDALCNDLFPSWKGVFRNGKAVPYTDDMDPSLLDENRTTTFFMDQKDLQSLLSICRHYKVHYNRRCPERPFEYLITIIMNIPWKQAKIITTIQRDIIYECYKLVTEALRLHTSKPLHSFDNNLLKRLVRAAILCDGFTVKQKSIILKNAEMECPKDLEIYLQEPPLTNDKELTSFFN